MVAEDDVDPARVGFLHASTEVDFFTGESHAHIRAIVVSKEAVRQGFGRALLAAAEKWAKERAYRLITLNVFPENKGAGKLYEDVGYEIDVLKMIKTVT